MADYFSRHCVSDYKRKALSDTLNINMSVTDTYEISVYIAKWLGNIKDDEIKAIEGFLDGLNKLNINSKMPKKMTETNKQKNESSKSPQDEISIYYGVKGKRQAAEYFLMEVLAQDKPETLLLYSDEATDWMTEDPEFAAKWA